MKFLDIRNYNRGHEIRLDYSKITQDENGITLKEYNKKYGIPGWIYCDTLELLTDERPCKKCNLVFKWNTPDPCLGTLKNVSGACCGHGIESKKYINYNEYNRKRNRPCNHK